MRRQRQSLWTSFPLSIAVASLFGGAVTAAVSLLMAAVAFLLLREVVFIRYIAVLDLFLGGISAGWICGKFRRRHGLWEGAASGAALYVLIAVLSLVLSGHLTSPVKIILLAIAGSVGGVFGVNSKRIHLQ